MHFINYCNLFWFITKSELPTTSQQFCIFTEIKPVFISLLTMVLIAAAALFALPDITTWREQISKAIIYINNKPLCCVCFCLIRELIQDTYPVVCLQNNLYFYQIQTHNFNCRTQKKLERTQISGKLLYTVQVYKHCATDLL